MPGYEELNAKINKLKRDGGVGYTQNRVITHDGKTSLDKTVVVQNLQFFKLDDKAIEPETIVSITANVGGVLAAKRKEELAVEWETDDVGGRVCYVLVEWEGTTFPLLASAWSIDGSEQLAILSDPDIGVYVSRIETETIHPIDPKYLPIYNGEVE